MKKLTLFLFLAACGDNIKMTPDAGRPQITDPTYEPDGIKPGDASQDASVPPMPDVDVSDAGLVAPDACIDSHIDLNGHEHKCNHDQDLPTAP